MPPRVLVPCRRAPFYAPAVTLRARLAPASRRRQRGIFCRSSAGSIGPWEHLTSAPDAGAATDLLRGIPVKGTGDEANRGGTWFAARAGVTGRGKSPRGGRAVLTEKRARERAPSAAVQEWQRQQHSPRYSWAASGTGRGTAPGAGGLCFCPTIATTGAAKTADSAPLAQPNHTAPRATERRRCCTGALAVGA
jgi:hypothetical protein